MSHIPVMMNEAVEALSVNPGDTIVDGTFGAGGYTQALLSIAECRVIAFDRDPDAVARAKPFVDAFGDRFDIIEAPFGDMENELRSQGISAVDGIVLDIGVSSFHLDDADRGFSFMRDGPLDMRMGKSGPSAADAVNLLPEADLATVIYRYGDDRKSRQIAHRIVARRHQSPFKTTLDLADTIEQAVGGRRGQRTHPATRAFQALRIFVNDELGELSRALVAGERLLAEGGRFVIVTFHSLEDRLVKSFFRSRSGGEGVGSRHLPDAQSGPSPSFVSVSKRKVSAAEADENPRARSATLRAALRTGAPPLNASADLFAGLPSLTDLEARL